MLITNSVYSVNKSQGRTYENAPGRLGREDKEQCQSYPPPGSCPNMRPSAMFGQVQTIIGNVSSSAGYPAKLFPMEVQVAFYRHNPTTRTSPATAAIGSLLLVGLLGGLGGLAGDLLGGGGLGTEGIRMLSYTESFRGLDIKTHLDDTDSNSLPHVPDGEPSQGRVVGEGLHAHGLAGEQLHDGSVSGLDELGRVLS